MVTMERGIPSCLARNRTHMAFAFPSTGGAVIFIFTAPSWIPMTMFLEDFGTTSTLKERVVDVSLICMGRV